MQTSPSTAALLKNEEACSHYKNIFDKYDINKDGYLSIKELKRMIESSQYEGDIPDVVIITIYKQSDKNNDERLDFEEFVDMVNNPNNSTIFQHFASKYVQLVVPGSPRVLSRAQTRTGLYEETCKCNLSTVFMISISVLEVLTFYLDQWMIPADQVTSHGPLYEMFEYAPNKRHEIWRFLSYMLVHSGNGHLWSNVAVQIILGVPLEMVHTWRVMVIYIAGVFFGSLASSVFQQNTIVIGASAGVYSFLTAHIATVILNWREMSYPAAHLIFFIILIFSNLFINTTETQSNLVHGAGTVAGLLVGVFVLRNFQVSKPEKIISWVCTVTFAVLTFSGIMYNFFT